MTNNQARFNEHVMAEILRLQYLSEMQLTSWELREPFQQPEPICEVISFSNESNELITQTLIDNATTEIIDVKTSESGSNSEEINQVSEKNEMKSAVDIGDTTDNAKSLDSFPASSTIEKNQFLNLVKWNSAIFVQSGSDIGRQEQAVTYDISSMIKKNILIVCRHKIDQPANSFASKRGPSYFMQDYLKTIVEFGLQNNFRLNIQLAHLAEAGLGESSIKIETYFVDKQPDFTFVLGDETVENLIDKTSDVKSNRCRLNKFSFNTNTNTNTNTKAIVSYHPFDLISNPRLKSLAYEDIQFLINTLRQVDV